jgi:hypothetical protein
MAEPHHLQEPRQRPQFTIRALLFVTLLIAISAAGFSGLIRAGQDDLSSEFVMFVVAAPLALLMIAGIWEAVQRILESRRQKRSFADRDGQSDELS